MADDDHGPSDDEIKLMLERHKGMALKNLSNASLAKRALTKEEIDLLGEVLFSIAGGFYDVHNALAFILSKDQASTADALFMLAGKMSKFETDITKLMNSLHDSLLFEEPGQNG